jgi:hypothetical protein
MAPASRGVERVDQLALVGGDLPSRVVHGLAGQRVFAREPAVNLACGRRAQVVTLGGELALVPEGVGPRRDGLGLQRLELGKGLGRELVRHDPLQVVLETHQVDDSEGAALRGPHLDRTTIGIRVDGEVVRLGHGHEGHGSELVPRLDEPDPSSRTRCDVLNREGPREAFAMKPGGQALSLVTRRELTDASREARSVRRGFHRGGQSGRGFGLRGHGPGPGLLGKAAHLDGVRLGGYRPAARAHRQEGRSPRLYAAAGPATVLVLPPDHHPGVCAHGHPGHVGQDSHAQVWRRSEAAHVGRG